MPPRFGLGSGARSTPASGDPDAAGGPAGVCAAADVQARMRRTRSSTRLPESMQLFGRPCIDSLLVGMDGEDGCQTEQKWVSTGHGGLSRRALGACQELGPEQERGHHGEQQPGNKRDVSNASGALHVYTSCKEQGALCESQRMRAISTAGQPQCQANSLRECFKSGPHYRPTVCPSFDPCCIT